MEQIVTYSLAYRQDQTVDLCAACAESEDEGGRGTLGAVSHGQRAGDCEGRVHAIDARADADVPSPRQIRALRQEAGEHGDMEMVAIGDQALAGEQGALDEVARVRADAITRALYEALDLAELRDARRFPGQG